MPTDRDDEARISAMLNQAEPPKSPRHLDAAILDYAAENAPAHGRESRGAFLSLGWLQQNWMPAAATLSVAAIAVSLSLQIFTEPDFTSPLGARSSELALGDAVVLKQADSTTAVSELEERANSADQLAVDSNSVATATAGIAPASSQQFSAPSVAVNNDLVEEVLVTGSSVRRAASTASVPTRERQSSFAENLTDDAALQNVVISVLRSSLGVSDQSLLTNSQAFSLRVNPLVESYRQLADVTALANVQSSYSLARAEQQGSRLPELIEALVVELEALPALEQ